MAHLAVVRSLHAHARIRGIAADQAREMPGVLVFTATDLPEVARGIPSPFGEAPNTRPYVQRVLASEVVRYVGEPVAVVVADDPYRLGDAMDGVLVDYEPLPSVMTLEAAARGNGRVHEDWPDNAATVARGETGDVDRAFPSADLIVEERLRHPRITAVPIEPRGVLAYRDTESGLLVVWSSTQNPYVVRDAVSVVLGIPAEEVRVLAPDVGGGFGPKGSVYHEELLVPAVALRLERPVKWVEGRREHFVATGHDREQVHRARIAFRRDGTIVGIDGVFQADVGAYPVEGNGLTLNTVNHLPGPYRVPNYRNIGTSYVTNKTQNAAYRGAGRPEAVFVMERLLDIGARRLGLDPIDVRRRNLVQPGEMPYRSGITYKDGVRVAYDPGDFPAALDRALELLGHGELLARRAAQAPRRGGSASASPATSRARALGPTRARRSASTRAARSSSPLASPHRARVTRRRSPRSARPSWVCHWTTSTSWPATPSSSRSAWAPAEAGSPRTSGPPSPERRGRYAPGHNTWPRNSSSARPRTSASRRDGRSSPASPRAP